MFPISTILLSYFFETPSKFLKDTKGILSEEQRMKLLFFEERMRNNLSKKIEDRRDKSPNNRREKRNFDSRRNK